MEDKRIFTSYLPNQTVNEYIRYMNNIKHSTQFRQLLQHNTDQYMKNENLKTDCRVNCHLLKNREPYYYENLYLGKKKHYMRE
jgi:hypothetical protein